MKVFGIGLSKTGTTSLARALEILGYRTKDNLGVVDYTPHDLSSIDLKVVDENDALTDTPIPSFYKELDEQYPNSKFIITVREMDGWLKSCKKQFTEKLADKQNEAHNQLFMGLYGCTVFDEEMFKQGYEKFVNEVYKYFQDRPQDLLYIDVSAGGGWEPLCQFLGKPVPHIPFPKANVTQIRWMNIEDVTTIAQQAGKESFSIYNFIRGDQRGTGYSGVGIFRMLRYLLPKARYRFSGNRAIATRMASRASQQVIFKKLQILDSKIPIIYPENSSDISYSERKNWNHFWLIETFGGTNHMKSQGAESDFSISISLIEDRIPILGVVYTPSIDITYYAMTGKGAFKVENDQEPEKLHLRKEHTDDSRMHSDSNDSFLDISSKGESALLTDALKICLIAEGKCSPNLSLQDTMEWQTAAAHAIAIASGLRIVSCNSNNELTYNKEEISNGCIVIE